MEEQTATEYLWEASLDGCNDECGDVQENGIWYGLLYLDELDASKCAELSGYAGAIISQDEQGFKDCELYATQDKADAAFESIQQEIADSCPGEDDLQTKDDIHFYQYGKLVLTVPEEQDRDEALREYMDAQEFWPNVWSISDHGNAVRIEL